MDLQKGNNMKAIVLKEIGPIENLEYVEDRPEPSPQAGEIKVKVAATGLNPVDYKLVHGWGAPDWERPPVLGLDVAGTVVELGEGVTDFAVGDRVFYHGNLSKCDGGFAEYATTTAHTVSKLPDDIPFESAAALQCAGFTAYQATVDKLKWDNDKTILVHAGAGGVGGYAIQLAKVHGAKKILTTCSARNAEYVKSLGADVAIDYNTEDVYEAVMRETDGRGVDYVIDTVDTATTTRDFDLIAFSGQIVAVVELPDFARLSFYEKGMSLHEVALGGAHINGDWKAQRRLAQIGDEYVKLIQEGKVKIPKTEFIEMKDIPDALRRLEDRHVSGKIVMVL